VTNTRRYQNNPTILRGIVLNNLIYENSEQSNGNL